MRIPAVLALALALVACGTTVPAPSAEPELVIVEGPVEGPGLSVAEALGHQPTDDIVTVSGALFVSVDGTVLLCDAIAESFPPQCGGASLLITGLDLTGIDGLVVEGDVMWTDRPIKLAGLVADGRLTMEDNAR
jgi:hypothetical protein